MQAPHRSIAWVWCLLACATLAHAGETRRFKSASYDITTDLPDEQAKEVADHMDAVHAEYTRRFSAYGKRNAEALRLWVFETQQGYMDFLEEQGTSGQGSGGMFFHGGKSTGLASFLGNRPMPVMLETLRHEGLHQFMYQRIGDNLPPWLNEGMAEWFGYALPKRRGFEMGLADPGAIQHLRKAAAENRLLPLETLLTMSKVEWNQRVRDGNASVQYDQAWSVVHFLAFAEGGRYQGILDSMLRSFWMGMDAERAVRTAVGSDLAPMEAAWRKYLDGLQPDELYAGLSTLRAYGALLAALDAMNVRPANAEELDAALSEHGATLQIDESLFPKGLPLGPDAWWRTLPAAARTGRACTARFVPDRRGQLPAGVELRGLKGRVSLSWSRGKDGRLAMDVGVD